MLYTPLWMLDESLTIGDTLRFDVFSASGTLLLARGQFVGTQAQADAMADRTVVFDFCSVDDPEELIGRIRPSALSSVWAMWSAYTSRLLKDVQELGFLAQFEQVAICLAALIDVSPDLAIYCGLQRQAGEGSTFSAVHSIRASVMAYLVARRMGWDRKQALLAVKCGLTMDVAVVESTNRPRPDSAAVDSPEVLLAEAHPWLSRGLLELAGVQDEDWLAAVELHHLDSADALKCCQRPMAIELAGLLFIVDAYLDLVSPYDQSRALAPDRAGRALLQADPSCGVRGALLKEMGLYPPGSSVSLANGDRGVVVKRTNALTAPTVAVLSTPTGVQLRVPGVRDTSDKRFRIVDCWPATRSKKSAALDAAVGVLSSRLGTQALSSAQS